jgi:hypothetical protein
LLQKCSSYLVTKTFFKNVCLIGNTIANKNDTSCPFNAKMKSIDEGKFEEGWIVDYYRKPYDKIFDSLQKINGKVLRSGKELIIRV